MSAYAAVASLLQTLDNLMRVSIGWEFQDQPILPGFLLETEKIQRVFTEATKLHISYIQLVSSHAYQNSFFNYIMDHMNPSAADVEQLFNIERPEMIEFEYLDRYFPELLIDGQWAHQLIVNFKTFNKTVTVMCNFYAQIRGLYQDLCFMLTCLDDFLNVPDDLLNRIRGICGKAKDAIEGYTMTFKIESDLKYFFQRLLKIHRITRRECRGPYEGMAKLRWATCYDELLASKIDKENITFFDSSMGVGRTLVQTLEEIKPIKAEITSNCRNMNDMIVSLKVVSLRNPKTEVLVGFDGQQLRILEELTGAPSGLEIVSIVGMGGIGKTTLAKTLFNHAYVSYHFDCRAWITVSPVYEIRDLLFGLVSSFAQRSDKINEKSNAELAETLYRSLKGKRYLIVMDDMWSIDAWNDVKRCFPDDKIGSRIIVTSRLRELANQIAPHKPPHRVNLLDAVESWELLQKLVFGNANCSPELDEVGEQIAKKCCGLPLVIVVIAGVLSRTIRTLDSWKHIAENLNSTVATDSEQCLHILALSYVYLPHHLRAFFLYMGAFPEDCEIDARKLINLWVAEGFLRSDSPRNLEQIGEDYLDDLIDRNLVMVEKRHLGGKVKTCRLHDFIKELCLSEAQKENFMNVVKDDVAKSFQQACEINAVSVSTWIPIVMFLQHQDSHGSHLSYVSLLVTFELPEAMFQLRNLQTFVIQGPWLRGGSSTLLLKYWRMPSLLHLHSSVAIKLMDVIAFARDLQRQHLQTLSIVRFSSCRQKAFTFMHSLKRLQICETKDDYQADRSCDLLNNLVYLRELETLKCGFYQQNEEPWYLSCLYAFPLTLTQLSLSQSYLPWEDMSAIARLQKLQVLKLKNYAFLGPEWMSKQVSFPSLKYLLIDNTDLVYWKVSVDRYPCLEKLILKSCKHLEEIPFDVDAIGSLQQMEVHYCSYPIEVLAKDFQEQGDGIDVVIRSDRSQHNAQAE